MLFGALGCLITAFLNLVVPFLAWRSLARRKFRVRWWAVLAVELLIAHVGISLGYHRYFSHRSFETSAAGKWTLATLGTLSLQGSPFYWAAQHRLHHGHCESDEDPHTPLHGSGRLLGFWHAHGGFLTGLTGPTIDQHPDFTASLVADLARDPDLSALARPPLVAAHPAAVMLGVPLLGCLVFGPEATLWYLHVPQFLAWHATLSVNSATHTFGYGRSVLGPSGAAHLSPLEPLRTPCRARNVPWLWGALLGEAWHANHHAAPHRATMGEQWWELDPQFELLKALERLGLVWAVRGPTRGAEVPGDEVPDVSLLLGYWRALQVVGVPTVAWLLAALLWRRLRSDAEPREKLPEKQL